MTFEEIWLPEEGTTGGGYAASLKRALSFEDLPAGSGDNASPLKKLCQQDPEQQGKAGKSKGKAGRGKGSRTELAEAKIGKGKADDSKGSKGKAVRGKGSRAKQKQQTGQASSNADVEPSCDVPESDTWWWDKVDYIWWRSCVIHGGWVIELEFWTKGNCCLRCRRCVECLERMMGNEWLWDDYQWLKDNHKPKWKKMVNRFDSECPEPLIKHQRRNVAHFNCAVVLQEFTVTIGKKAYTLIRMMHRDFWMENAQTTEYGSYTIEEAAAMWADWVGDPNVFKDKLGPRGLEQCEVVEGRFGERFNQETCKKKISAEVAKVKKPSESQLIEHMQKLFVNHSHFGGQELEKFFGALKVGFATDGSGQGGQFSSVLSPTSGAAADGNMDANLQTSMTSMQELLDDAVKRNNKNKNGGVDNEGGASADAVDTAAQVADGDGDTGGNAEQLEGTEVPEAGTAKRGKAWDAEIEIARSKRLWGKV